MAFVADIFIMSPTKLRFLKMNDVSIVATIIDVFNMHRKMLVPVCYLYNITANYMHAIFECL